MVWREKERARKRAVQMYDLRGFVEFNENSWNTEGMSWGVLYSEKGGRMTVLSCGVHIWRE